MLEEEPQFNPRIVPAAAPSDPDAPVFAIDAPLVFIAAVFSRYGAHFGSSSPFTITRETQQAPLPPQPIH